MWEELIPLAKYVQAGEKILDLGCGNGRLFAMLKEKNIEYLGVDSSDKMINIAREKHGPAGAKFLTVEALELPFPESYFQKIFSVAVLHHIPSEEFRLKFLSEIKRVLKPRGLLILTVWNLRKNYWLLFKYTILKFIGKSKLDSGDVLWPWKNSEGKTVIERYIHCFARRELEKLAEKAGFKIEEAGFLDRGKSKKANIYLIAEK